jgi:hypothetical protein
MDIGIQARDSFKLKSLATTCQPWIGRLTLTNDNTQYIKAARKMTHFKDTKGVTRNSKSKKARPKNGHRKKEQQNAIQKNKDCATGALQQTRRLTLTNDNTQYIKAARKMTHFIL